MTRSSIWYIMWDGRKGKKDILINVKCTRTINILYRIRNSYDEWIPSTRALEHNDVNLQRKMEGAEAAPKVTKSKAKKLRTESPITPQQPTSTTTEPPPDTKTQPDPASIMEPMMMPPSVPPPRIKIPDGLKSWLTFDWTAINRQHRSHVIPAKTTVQDIIAAYTIYRAQLDSVADETSPSSSSDTTAPQRAAEVRAVTDSLIEYFDMMLGTQLLYKNDRAQYTEVLGQHPPDAPMSRVYGSFHLLRLFMRLDELLVHSQLEPAALGRVTALMQEFLHYLDEHSETYFSRQQFVALPTPQ